MDVEVDVVVGIDIPNDPLMTDAIQRLEHLEEGVQFMQDHILEMPIQRFMEIEAEQREQEARNLIADGERSSLLGRVAALEGNNTRLRDALGVERVRANSLQRRLGYVEDEFRQIRELRAYESQRLWRIKTFLMRSQVTKALAAQEANRNAGLVVESQSQNMDDNDNGNGGNGNRGNNNGNGNQNGGNGGARRNAPVTKACTYKDFRNCQPCNFSGTEGFVGLARWFEKMELVFRVSNFPPNSQVKFSTCTLHDGALTWWNSHMQTIGIDEAYEITDIIGYTRRFQELTLLCPRVVLEEEDKIKRYIWGLPNNIQGNMTSSLPTRLQDAIRMANGLKDQKVRVYTARSDEQKRKFNNNPQDNRV
ncbi:hypothetical protein Tco_1289632 [Tanacetum coccineum]